MNPFIRHVVTDIEDNLQRCVICGEIITDYRNGAWHPAPKEPPKGWASGPVYVSKGFPTVYVAEIGDEPFINCKAQ